MVCEGEVKNGILKVKCLGCLFGASLEDFDVCMAKTIDKIIENRKVISVVLAESREYEYDFEQTKMLVEIAEAILEITRNRKLTSFKKISASGCEKYTSRWFNWLQNLVMVQMRGDPIGAYLSLIREIRHLKIIGEKSPHEKRECIIGFLESSLFPIQEILENCSMIQKAKPYLTGYHVGDRSIYREIFKPSVRPNFMYTKYMTEPPVGEIVEKYELKDASVQIFKIPDEVRYHYHIIPAEFKLSENEYTLLDASRRILEERKPKELEMKDQSKMRDLFQTLSSDLINDVSEQMSITLKEGQLQKLSNVLTRYTAGLGILELLLSDNRIQDIYINSPLGTMPVYLFHQDFEECKTNLVPTRADGERWATRFKLLSGRPLDESNPVLDTELIIPGGTARIAAINPGLSPDGLAFAIRRHRSRPWTFPLFINARFIDPTFAGLMWFMASYGRTFLMAGTRSSGKTSLLGSMMLQILPYYRIITVEDTLELPVVALRKLGYNIERMKSRSVITKVELELPAEEALRAALRLGDSCLFIGEVRSTEAKALYEAMRIGAMANAVAGTIHGESAYGVFDRVVNDLGVPPTSFKATDLVVVCNRLKTADGIHTFRRVVEVTEVKKHWKNDPMDENGFVNLMEYSAAEDKLKPTDTLLNGESYILNEIAKRVPGWTGRWNRIWDNIELRGNILKTIVDISNKTGNKELMEAETVVKSNQWFHKLSEESLQDTGIIDSKMVYDKWIKKFKEHAKGI